MKRRAQHVLLWAFGLSLAMHFLFAPLAVRFKVVEANKDDNGHYYLLPRRVKPTPRPPKPKSTPKPARSTPAAPRPATHPKPPTLAFHGGTGRPAPGATRLTGGTGTPGPEITPGADAGPGYATAAPQPTATPKPLCSAPDSDASTIEKYSPEMPEEARAAGLGGYAQVRVDLSETGSVEAATIAKSTGSTLLDRAAVLAARRTTYAPKTVDCKHVPGSYLFRVEFDPN